MNPNGLIIDEWDDITENYFGTSYPSQLLYESINGFEDFNRYIIGTNSRNTSNIYRSDLNLCISIKNIVKQRTNRIIHYIMGDQTHS